MSLRRPDIRCDWNNGHDLPRFLKDYLHPPGRCAEPATHVALIGPVALRPRPVCAAHSQRLPPGSRVAPLVLDPRVGVLVAFAIAGFSDPTLDRLIADLAAGGAGADVVLLDYVEQSGMVDPGFCVTFAGRTWLEGPHEHVFLPWHPSDDSTIDRLNSLLASGQGQIERCPCGLFKHEAASCRMTRTEEREIIAVLDSVSRTSPASLVGETWAQVFAGNVTFEVHGWTVVVFNDCMSWDYLDSLTAPDGRTWQFVDMTDRVRNWQPENCAGWPSVSGLG